MSKIKKILWLNDPPPNPWYEISCYLKTAVAFILLIFGCFLLHSPVDWEEKIFGQYFAGLTPVVGILSVSLGVWGFMRIKIVRQLFKILKSSRKK